MDARHASSHIGSWLNNEAEWKYERGATEVKMSMLHYNETNRYADIQRYKSMKETAALLSIRLELCHGDKFGTFRGCR